MGHLLSTYTKFSEKLTFLTPRYAHVRVYQGEVRNVSFLKILRMHLVDDSYCC